MMKPFIIDAHLHVGASGMYFAPGCDVKHLLELMDRLQIEYAVCSEMKAVLCGSQVGMQASYDVFEQSNGRIFFQGVFDPRNPQDCLKALEEAAERPGFVGLKIHPSMHGTPAESPGYEAAWAFARKHQCAILAHTWSVSDYNPGQAYSTPERFENHISKFPGVHFVLGHAGGKGGGRAEAIRLANKYNNVYLDFAGDIFCYRFFETMLNSVPVERILYGSDYPMLDPRANLSRVLLGDMDEETKLKILRENAIQAYGLGDMIEC
jgi:predicted TIM-barrel fold metal-dependent hydrolase